MQTPRTFRVVFLVLILLFMVMFFVENMDPVQVYFPMIKGRHCGLIFIMMGSYFMGVLSSFLFITIIGGKIRKKMKPKAPAEEQEEEELFDEE
ncbi:MAG: hypothetical protein HQL28_05275 [Candidatus Omnitrophica bacterium]|nr:hypothetical protein [Candidatus Omnitrophota bacterium]